MSTRTPREALTRVFALDGNPGVVVTRATPEHMADEVIRELAAQGFSIVPHFPVVETRSTSRRGFRPMVDGIDYDSSEQ